MNSALISEKHFSRFAIHGKSDVSQKGRAVSPGIMLGQPRCSKVRLGLLLMLDR